MSLIDRARRALDRLLSREDMTGDGVCPVYLRRWTLLRRESFTIYLHHFLSSDWSRDVHDHPKPFISIGLLGRYIEHTPFGASEYKAPWFRIFASDHRHRLQVLSGETCWTIAIAGATERSWGFWLEDQWIYWSTYVKLHGKERRACL